MSSMSTSLAELSDANGSLSNDSLLSSAEGSGRVRPLRRERTLVADSGGAGDDCVYAKCE